MLLYEGSNSTTRAEIGKVMDLLDVNACNAYQQLLNSLPLSESGNTILITANAVWMRHGFPFRAEYVETLKACYEAELKYFTNVEELIKEVNSWVSNKTKGLIKEFLNKKDVNEGVVAVLVSVIYFKAKWVEEFKPSESIMFWTGSRYVKVPAMEVISDVINVIRNPKYVAVEIPYMNTNISMIIIMPNNYSEIRSKYREFILDVLSKLYKSREVKGIKLIMPKFNITFKLNLIPHLQELGINEVFTPGKADLTRMANVKRGNVWVSKVKHQAVIKVHEKGTEAAAATAIIMVVAYRPIEKVIIDKPFIYLLRDKESNAILFIGHVVNPLEK